MHRATERITPLELWRHLLPRELTNSQVHVAVVRNRFNMHCLLEVGSLKISQKLRDRITRSGGRCELRTT